MKKYPVLTKTEFGKNVTQRPFSVLADCEKIYQSLLEIYERETGETVCQRPSLNTHTHHFLTGWTLLCRNVVDS